jgi:hypothetical protein
LRDVGTIEKVIAGVTEQENNNGKQRQFFEFAGPLFTVTISPASSVVRVGNRDRCGRYLMIDLAAELKPI